MALYSKAEAAETGTSNAEAAQNSNANTAHTLKEEMEASEKRKSEVREKRKKSKRVKKVKPPTQNDLLKIEIAKELGLEDKITAYGFGGLTARETGRIGGLMTARKKEEKRNSERKNEQSR